MRYALNMHTHAAVARAEQNKGIISDGGTERWLMDPVVILVAEHVEWPVTDAVRPNLPGEHGADALLLHNYYMRRLPAKSACVSLVLTCAAGSFLHVAGDPVTGLASNSLCRR